jgi:hypothetical protein
MIGTDAFGREHQVLTRCNNRRNGVAASIPGDAGGPVQPPASAALCW